MRFIVGQWIVIGIILGVVAIIWEHIVNPLNIGLPFKLWLTALISWIIVHILLLIMYRLCLSLMTQKEGVLYGVNLMLWGIAFTCYDIALTLTTKTFLHRTPPIPLLKLYGLKCGKNFSAAIGAQLGDPELIEFGDNCRIGGFSIVTAHFLEGNKVIRKKVKLGNNVEVGGMALVSPGVTVEDNTVIGGLSFVPKDAYLNGNAIYAGVPAKKIKSLDPGMAGTQGNKHKEEKNRK
ncbi:MAG: acyltransferase [Promethearchaeota archaeon]